MGLATFVTFVQSIKGNGYEAQLSSMIHAFLHFFGFDRAQNTIGFELRSSN